MVARHLFPTFSTSTVPPSLALRVRVCSLEIYQEDLSSWTLAAGRGDRVATSFHGCASPTQSQRDKAHIQECSGMPCANSSCCEARR